MKRLIASLGSILMAVVLTSTPQPGVAAGGPESIMVKRPIHTHRAATPAPTGYFPAQIRHAYGIDQLSSANGSNQIIGIVDAYDDPTIKNDLSVFIATFGLPVMHGLTDTDPCTLANGPHPCFVKACENGVPAVTGTGTGVTESVKNEKKSHKGPPPPPPSPGCTLPSTDGGWALEISLDVEWAHAIAPGADIVLVEANTSFISDLMTAVDSAVALGATAVSMSWGAPEQSGLQSLESSHFQKTGVMFVAASGDNGAGVYWPAVDPFVVGVGGTHLPLDGAGNLTGPETAWSGSGGGISLFTPEPTYQLNFGVMGGGGRGVPDVAWDADPATGVAIYDSTPFGGATGWWQVGGTSVGAPSWAAVLELANQTRTTKLTTTYTSSPLYFEWLRSFGGDYRDITSGSNGSFSAGPGYDFVTGLGTPLANLLVPALTGY